MPVATAETVYREVVGVMPLPEQLRLATMVLNHIPPEAIVDCSEEWTEEDYRDFSAASHAHVSRRLEEAEEHAEAR
jgi:hypothetical protein